MMSLKKLLLGYFLLLSFSCVSGRELTCEYGTVSDALWPTSNQCQIKSVDLSESFRTVEHSFSGTQEQKSAVSVVHFESPSQIEYIPKQILTDFPRLNGIRITNADTFTILNDNLFNGDFGAIQYLDLSVNQIATVEANAFQQLTNLKWISLQANQLSSLQHQIFRNNPELVYIGLGGNQISSITPDLFDTLGKLQYLSFNLNQCADKEFGCTSGSCSVPLRLLYRHLTLCFDNCLQDGECAVKSGRLDYLSSDEVRKNFDLIISSGHVGKLIEKHNNLMTERIFNLTGETTSNLKSVQEEIGQFKNESQESNAKTLEAISKNSDEIKNVAKKFEETLKLEMAELKGKLERDIAEMKTKLEENLEKKFSEIFQKKFDDFARKLTEEKRA